MSNFTDVARDIEESAKRVIDAFYQTKPLPQDPDEASRLVAKLWRESVPKHIFVE